MKQELKTIFIAAMLVSSLMLSITQFIPHVKADQGSAKVYVLQLSGVGKSWVDDTSRVKEGAMDACTPYGKYERIPSAHPAHGTTPPFYDVSCQVIGSWSTYVNLILNEAGVIIVNTHGEILPIPTGYSKEEWVDVVAEAMWKRRVTWAHMAGYPFYWVWHQADADKTLWGSDGFKRLMGHIGLPDVAIPKDLPPDTRALLTGQAKQSIATRSWDFYNATHVGLVRPLKKSDFANYTVLPLYKRALETGIYWEGAVIAFAKPGQRIDADETEGSGSFIHLGTDKTLDEPRRVTDRDYNRGYVVTAAAIWAESLHFETKSGLASNNLDFHKDTSLGVAPCITGYWWEDDLFKIRLVFGVYGVLRYSEGSLHHIQKVMVEVYDLPAGCTAQAQLHLSKQGQKTGIELTGPWVDPSEFRKYGLVVKGATLLLPLLVPAVAPFMPLIGGVMLFSDWMVALGDTPQPPGSDIFFDYEPVRTVTELSAEDNFEEFQSLIVIDLEVPTQEKQDWRLISLDYRIRLETTTIYDVEVRSGLSIAAWFDPGDYVMVFFEDFEDGMEGWSVGDLNSHADCDYWGRSTYFRPYGAWCAQVGTNSLNDEIPNIEVSPWPVYDDGMNAYLQRSIDLRSFKNARLSFRTETHIKSGDYVTAECYLYDEWTEIVTYDDPSGTGYWETHDLPINATEIRFRFVSNNDNQVDWGVFLDNIEIKGWLHNDAFRNVDAPNNQSGALNIGISSTLTNWAGYINGYDDLHDWYSFDISSSNINDGKEIYVWLKSPTGADFDVALYDESGTKKAESSYSFTYHLQSSDTPGLWAIEIYHKNGFGQYDFDMQLKDPSPGGCPFVYVWNGNEYVVDNNLLPASEVTNGSDVEDYYVLEQTLVATYQGRWLSWYSLQISESENEHSYLDRVKLLAVDHPADVNVAVTPEGTILTYGDPYEPVSCVDNYGVDQRDPITFINDEYYEGMAGNYLNLDFGDLDISAGAKLVMRADFPEKDMSIHIQILNSTFEWETVAVVEPRVFWATEIVDLLNHLPDANGELKVRLYFTAQHKIDYVGLDTTPQQDFQLHEAYLLSAIHSTQGNVRWRLLNNDNTYAELIPSEQIRLIFLLPNSQEQARTFIFYTNGYYKTIQNND